MQVPRKKVDLPKRLKPAGSSQPDYPFKLVEERY